MTTETLQLSDDYLLDIDITEVPAVQGYHLCISSRWLGAKHPEESQKRFSVTLPPAHLSRVASVIQAALQRKEQA